MADRTECMIRLDDITPDMDWDKFGQVKEIFDRFRICPLIGVVPENKDKNLHKEEPQAIFWERIRSLQKEGFRVAQHGTNHVYETENAGILGINPFSEFAGLTYEEQLVKIKKGKAILEQNGIETDIFMAPGHTYDANTLKALKECGFTVVTDGLSKNPYYDEEILFIPCRLRGFKKPSGIDTVCLHTNLMTDADMEELETFCQKYKTVIVPFDPDRYRMDAGKRKWNVKIEEYLALYGRNLKDKIANSNRLAWYMNRTNHKNSKIKWLKRLVSLPLLLFYRGE